VFDSEPVRAAEFLRRVKKLARRTNTPCRFVAQHGKGSHGTLYFGPGATTVKDLKKEMSESLLHDMCRQLGIDKKNLY